MGIEVVFKIAGIGIVIAVITQVLKQAGKDEIATLTTLAGLIVVLTIVVDLISELFSSVQNLFGLY
ncbi:MAG: stage III sporulation protein AC [Clostridia bacterium]|nr:stage III sporulation protein AC [Clostridia bacterium]